MASPTQTTPTPNQPLPPTLIDAGLLIAPTLAGSIDKAAIESRIMGRAPSALALRSRDRYEVFGEHARGGLGRILRATDRDLGRTVALKELLVPTGGSGKDRFAREALVTARLEHPGIVPVYDAGQWGNDEPFYAMKLVSGRPLNEIIDETQSLNERLALLPKLIAVADAIAYAHSEGIIHRDLKPANVIIGDFGEAVVIDWGLAKNLGEDEEVESSADSQAAIVDRLTVDGAVLGTPAYMPLEQAKGLASDARSDVYSLGAMLYHLLSGQLPHAEATDFNDTRRRLEGELAKPLLTVDSEIPADLVAIVEKAMAKRPGDRYPSAKELATDLQLFATGQLVGARQYSLRALLGRWLRRNRAIVIVATSLLAVLALTSALGVRAILHEREVAQNERDTAEHQRDKSEEMVDYMVGDLERKLQSVGRLDMLDGVGDTIINYYDSVGTRDGDALDRRAKALLTMGRVSRDKGDLELAAEQMQDSLRIYKDLLLVEPENESFVHGFAKTSYELGATEGFLGSKKAALDTYSEAVDRIEKAAPGVQRGPLAEQLSLGLVRQGANQFQLGLFNEAKVSLERGLELMNRLRLDKPNDVAVQNSQHEANVWLGDLADGQGDIDTAMTHYQAALVLLDAIVPRKPDDVGIQDALWQLNDRLSYAYLIRSDYPTSMKHAQTGLTAVERLTALDPDNSKWTRNMAITHTSIGDVAEASGKKKEAMVSYLASRDLLVDLTKLYPKNLFWLADLGRSYERIGDASINGSEEAMAAYQKNLEIYKRLAEGEPENTRLQRGHSAALGRVGATFMHRKKPDQALPYFQGFISNHAKLLEKDPNNGQWRGDVADTSMRLADCFTQLKDYDEALVNGLRGVEILASIVAEEPEYIELQLWLAESHGVLAAVHKARGDKAEAKKSLRSGIDVMKVLTAKDPNNKIWAKQLTALEADLR